jgi:hypothetical protein
MGEPNIAELAVAAWRLERWLDNLNAERKMAAKKSLREIKKFLDASDIEVVDPLGWKFDPGLAVEVVNNEADDVDEEELIIIQTNSPVVKQNGAVIQYGKVILGLEIKEQKSNNELRTSEEATQNEMCAVTSECNGLLSQGPIYVANYGGFPCWVRRFDCKATKVGYHALIGVFSDVDTEVCLMDEQVYKEYQAGLAPRNPFMYKPKAGAAYIAPPYPDIWYLIVWPLTGEDGIGTRFDSNCEWAINQQPLKKSDGESDGVRNSQGDSEQKDDSKTPKEDTDADRKVTANGKSGCDSQEKQEVTGTDGECGSTEHDVPDMSEKALERLMKRNISSYNLHRAMDKGLISQIHGKKK